MSAATDLTAASWQQFSRLLDQALELPPVERGAWIDALEREHDALKPALRAVLLRARGVETAQWLDALPHTAGAASIADKSDLQPGALVGPYRLIREIGSGEIEAALTHYLSSGGGERGQPACRRARSMVLRARWGQALTIDSAVRVLERAATLRQSGARGGDARASPRDGGR